MPDKQRTAQIFEHMQIFKYCQIMRYSFAESEAGVNNNSFPGKAMSRCPGYPFSQKTHDFLNNIIVQRVVLHILGSFAHMHENHRRLMGDGDSDHRGIEA